MPGIVFPVFEPEERTAVDALTQILREQMVRNGLARRTRSFPFLEHNRKVAGRLRAAGVRLSLNQVSSLLLDWARSCGNIDLYVHQPYAFWVETTAIEPVPDFLRPSCTAVASAPTSFFAYANGARLRRS